MKFIRLSCFFIAATSFVLNVSGQTVWTDGAADQTWSTPGNWSSGVPISTSNVQIGTQPTGDQIGIDTGATTVASFVFNNTLSANTDITAFGSDTLQVNGAITNNSSFQASFSLGVIAGSSAIWSGPLTFSNTVVVGVSQITVADSLIFSGNDLSFSINSVASYGRFLGLGGTTVTGVTINFTGTYTGSNGDSFDFTPTNFSGAILGTLPTLSGGLTWNSSDFLSSGVLTVVPEPTTLALVAGGMVCVVAFRRRRSA